MEAVLFIGIQATGKSTFYREVFWRTHVRISLDQLRTRARERRFVETCLETRQPFVIDNTNCEREDRQRYVEPARQAGFRVIGYYFQSKLLEAMARNSAREAPEVVPDKGLRGAYGRLVLPSFEEGFDALHYVQLTAKLELLRSQDIDFEARPGWEKRGTGFYWESYEKLAENPLTGETATATRKRLSRELDLPVGNAYGNFTRAILVREHAAPEAS